MRQMVDDGFTAEYDVSVNLKLIATRAHFFLQHLRAYESNVSMDADPVGMGIRNAVIQLLRKRK